MVKINQFKVQMLQDVVRSNRYSDGEFVLLAKLIQIYYIKPDNEKSFTITINHKSLMNILNINDNKTFKKHLNGLYVKGAIHSEIESLPRTKDIEIQLNKEFVPEFSGGKMFTQMESIVLNKSVIKAIKFTGIRLLYYYMSYVNYTDRKKNHCFAAEETIAKHIGSTRKTVNEYNKKLSKKKFIEIVQHEIEYSIGNDVDVQSFHRYNNHYHIRHEKIEEFVHKNSSILA